MTTSVRPLEIRYVCISTQNVGVFWGNRFQKILVKFVNCSHPELYGL